MWVVIIATVAFFMISLYGWRAASKVLHARRLWREVDRRTKLLCPTCGYDIRESDQTCPECGGAIGANWRKFG